MVGGAAAVMGFGLVLVWWRLSEKVERAKSRGESADVVGVRVADSSSRARERKMEGSIFVYVREGRSVQESVTNEEKELSR